MNAGIERIAYNLPREELLKQTVVLPADVGLLASLRALNDVTNGQPDVLEIYSKYLEQLDAEINADSSQRVYQHYLLLLKQEISTIESTLSKQFSIFRNLLNNSAALPSYAQNNQAKDRYVDQDYYDNDQRGDTTYVRDISTRKSRNATQGRHSHSNRINPINQVDEAKFFGFSKDDVSIVDKISATAIEGLRKTFAQDCVDHIDKRLEFFSKLKREANYLDQVNAARFTVSQDKRELAIYAFSIVTVIFLPSSTVAGIFGMNTNDMRNLQQNQWIFWAVATPLSVVVIIVGLLWAGELGNAWAGFLNFWSRGRKHMTVSAGPGHLPPSENLTPAAYLPSPGRLPDPYLSPPRY
ncbi:hypothetical protein MMC10_011364 [Thelotrema lepadinum]|nr:hypothetical protein [Thelotrema lepadinum]